jgi:bifunctional non-homologous end joining protein LigD
VKLGDYRKKRSAAATNEPFGGEPPEEAGPTKRGAFVVHLHDATRTHYDLRLEVGHVLASFAVPRGPSLDPAMKHLAVHTEDHPLEYLDFEDVIPDGQYGAGPMIVWDRGRVDYLEAPAEEGIANGKLDFWLTGYKLNGRFALVLLKKQTKTSKAGQTEWLLLKKKDAWSSPDRDVTAELPRSVLSGLAIDELAQIAARGEALEEACAAAGAKVGAVDPLTLVPSAPTEATAAPRGAGFEHELVLGGVRVLVAKVGDDAMVVRGGRDVRELYPEVARAVAALPPRGVVLDGEIVAFDETGRPSPTRLAQRIARAAGGDVHGAVLDAPVTMLVSDVLAVGARDLRPLPLAKRRPLLAQLLPGRGVLRATDAFDGDAAPLVAFCKEHGIPGILSRKRDAPYEAGPRPTAASMRLVVTETKAVENADLAAPPPPKLVPVTNRQKIFWKDEGYTKGDLVSYYEAIAPAILPYLHDRPIAVVRYPDGIGGKSFFQWNVPPGMPKWVSSFALRDEETERGEKRVFIVNDVPSLLYIANLACIPIHVLACKRGRLAECDFFTVDFDLKLAKLEHAISHARTLRELLSEIGLVGYPKTSGQSGLHVLVPLGPGVSFATARALADLVGRLIVQEHPETATIERVVKKRGDKVYVDTGQTGPTRMIVAPYSVRAYPGATVSTPLEWGEVTKKLDPSRFTIKTVPARFEERGDPMAPMLPSTPDVPAAVGKLEKLLARG